MPEFPGHDCPGLFGFLWQAPVVAVRMGGLAPPITPRSRGRRCRGCLPGRGGRGSPAGGGRAPGRCADSKRWSACRCEGNAGRGLPFARSRARQGPFRRWRVRGGAAPVVPVVAASRAWGIGKLASFPRRRTACAASWPMLQASASPRRSASALSRGDAMLSRAWPGGAIAPPPPTLRWALRFTSIRIGSGAGALPWDLDIVLYIQDTLSVGFR